MCFSKVYFSKVARINQVVCYTNSSLGLRAAVSMGLGLGKTMRRTSGEGKNLIWKVIPVVCGGWVGCGVEMHYNCAYSFNRWPINSHFSLFCDLGLYKNVSNYRGYNKITAA